MTETPERPAGVDEGHMEQVEAKREQDEQEAADREELAKDEPVVPFQGDPEPAPTSNPENPPQPPEPDEDEDDEEEEDDEE